MLVLSAGLQMTLCSILLSVSTLVAADEPVELAKGLRQLSGTDRGSGISYRRIALDGAMVAPDSLPDAPPLPPSPAVPVLTAQCTHRPDGRFGFELFVNDGGVEDISFHAPWTPSGTDLFPPPTRKTAVTFRFYGYTRVKPVTRQWEFVLQPAGELRYNPPSGGSSNLEEAAYFLQYMRSLPTLRLTHDGKALQFQTGPLLEAIRKEPLCHASGLS